MPALIIAFTFMSVALLAGAVLYPLLSKRSYARERIARLMSPEEEQPQLVHSLKKWQKVLADMGNRMRMNPADLGTYRKMVTAAGFRKERVYVFLGAKLFLTIALPVAYLSLFAVAPGRITGKTTMFMALGCATLGYLLPTFWLTRRAESRKTEIFHSLPDVLDLLTVCVEAGLSLDAALIKTVENFQKQRDPLIQEINLVTLEVRAGKPRSESLKSLADRTSVDDIKSFVAMLVQTEKFGTSLGRTLRIYAESLRTKRKQLAEERAAKTAIKMLFPLTFFVFPAILVVILAPAVCRINELFHR